MAGPLNLTLRINADGTAAITGLNKVTEETRKFGPAAQQAGEQAAQGFGRARAGVQSISEQLKEMQQGMLALAGLHFGKELVADIVQANSKLQGWKYGLEAATGSQQKAAESLAFVRAESNRLGISLEDSASTFTRLAAATKNTALEGAGAQKVFTGVAEAARTLHLSGAETNSMLIALDQMMSKGTVQAQELKLQMGNVLPGAMHVAADAMGVTVAQLDKMMEQGKLVSDDFLPKFAARLHELYGATAADASTSPAAQLERLKNAVFELKAAIGDAGFMATLANHARMLTTVLSAVVQSGALDIIVRGLLAVGSGMATAWALEKVVAFAGGLQAVRNAIAATALATVGMRTAQLEVAAATTATTAAQTGLNVAMRANPIGIVITALFALYEAYEYVSNANKKRAEEMAALNRQVDAATLATQGMNEALRATDGSGFGKLSEAARLYGNDMQTLGSINDEIAKKQKEFADASVVYLEHGIRAFDDSTPKARALKEEIAGLQAKAARLAQEMPGLRAQLEAAGRAAGQSADFVKDMGIALAAVRNAASTGDLVGALKNAASAWSSYAGHATDAFVADKKAAESWAVVTDGAKKATEALATAGKTRAQIAQMHVDAAIKDAQAAGTATATTIANMKTEGAAYVAKEAALDAVKHKQRDLTGEMRRFDDQLEHAKNALAGMQESSNAYTQALNVRTRAEESGTKLIEDARAAFAKHIITQKELNEAIRVGGEIQATARANYADTTAKIKEQDDSLGGLWERLRDQESLIGLTERQRAYAQAVNEATKYLEAHREQMGLDDAGVKQIAASFGNAALRVYDHTDAVKLNEEVARGWASIWQQAGDGVSRIFSDVLVRGGSLFKGLRDLAKQTVGSIIDYFAKLAVINPILKSIFGASAFGGSLLPMMANAAGGGGTPLNQTAGIVQQVVAGSSGGAGGAAAGGFDFTSAASWIGAGKNLWEGFSSLFGSGGSQSILGSLAGKGEWDVGGAFGGQLANIGAGIGGAFGGYQLGQGLGLGKGGSLALGAGVGALSYFVPVVGWVMGIASLLNTLSGGNVFGTGWNANGETKTNLSIGAMGANIANQYEEKKKGALFSGNSYRWRDAALSEDQKAYADQITAAMQKVRDSAAGALGVEAANIVTAAFQQRWNKDGKVTEEVSTVMGRTYKETMDKFILRVQAENVLAQIDKALGSGEASQIAEKYRSNADTLSDAAKMLLAAQVDVKHGASLLGDDKSLSNIAAIVGQLKAENEALAATYARLQTETQALKSTLDVMGLSIGKTGADFVKFADAASNAAGGVDKLQSMLGAFQKAYYSADEIAKAQIAALQRQSQGALSGLGVDPAISMADLRTKIEGMMPTLSPDELVQWINAANLLAAATDAQKQYNAALAKNAADVQAMLGQMNPAGDPNAGTWAATLAAINTQFDAAIAKLTALGATADQLAQAEQYRVATIAKAQKTAQDNYNAIVAQITGGIAQFGKPEDGLQKALDTIAQAEAATIAQLEAAAKAAGMQGVAEADLAAVHQFAAMQAQAAKDAAAAAHAQAVQAYTDLAAGIGTALADTLAPLSAYQQALRQSETQLKENIDKLNAAAKAAGMQGAAEGDLARAHQLAAAQVRAAIAQLRNSTLDQGKKLGYIDSVDSLTARIADLQNSIGKAASGFEGAAQSVSSAASDLAESMKLALGNLSPYTDEKKLQLALQGLASGTASREDVLGIGRRLYASTDRYAQLYEQVMGMPDLTKQTGGGLPASFYAGPATPAVDTSAVMLQIEALTKQRDAMLAAQKHADALAFAQQVADLAQAEKIGVGDELAKLGVNIDALAKDLGVNGDVLADYIATLKRDSLGDTFKDVGQRIIDAIHAIGTLPIAQPVSRSGPPVDVIEPIPVPPRERAATREDMGELTERMADVFKRLSEIADKFADVPERKRQGAALESIAEATADTATVMPALRRSVDDLVHTLRQR